MGILQGSSNAISITVHNSFPANPRLSDDLKRPGVECRFNVLTLARISHPFLVRGCRAASMRVDYTQGDEVPPLEKQAKSIALGSWCPMSCYAQIRGAGYLKPTKRNLL